MAIKIKLRRSEKAEMPELSVVDLKTEKEVVAPFPIPVCGGDIDVRNAMEAAILREHKKLCGISRERMLVLHVQSPSVPTLDFVDLPGLCSMPHKGEPKDMPDQTRELIMHFVEAHKQHAVFLLVIPASQDPRVAPIMEIVTKHSLQKQSIGGAH
jgi:hypothetical protein